MNKLITKQGVWLIVKDFDVPHVCHQTEIGELGAEH